MNHNTVTIFTTNCSCHLPLLVDSAYDTYQICTKQVTATRRKRRIQRGEGNEVSTRSRGRPRADPAGYIPTAYISQLYRLRPLNLGRNPNWESCCKRGSVQLQLLPDPPQYLKDLLASTDTHGRHFKDNLRQYNAAFAFTSLKCDIASAEERTNNENNRGGLHAFQIHGELYHFHGPLLPTDDGSNPSYVQLYIYNPSFAAERRLERNDNLDPEIIRELSVMLA
ncbi:hypothetical protein RMATCC62417_08250 [Rhizopus microsporus]|nr:hypothetical protein RMATCC62417_08250 [Rhizopus microsporus]